MMRLSFKAGCVICLVVLLSASCAHAPVGQADGNAPTIGEKAALTAVSMIGKPYRYKGNTPAGFDCSGLVQYSYLAAGAKDVPHGTKALVGLTRSIGKDLQTGDLLFFNERGKKYSHVGIYLENGTFVHAPATGGRVKKDLLEDPYWKGSFVDARRFMEPPEVPR
jgi:cell wall-associated NlpC family hydrolase